MSEETNNFRIVRTSPSEMWEDFTSGKAFQEGGEIAADIGTAALETSAVIGIVGGPLAAGMTAAWGLGVAGLGKIVSGFGDMIAGEAPMNVTGSIKSLDEGYKLLDDIDKNVSKTLEGHYGQPRSVPVVPWLEERKDQPPASEEAKQLVQKVGSYEAEPYPGSDEYKKMMKERKRQELREREAEAKKAADEAAAQGGLTMIKEEGKDPTITAEMAYEDPSLEPKLDTVQRARLIILKHKMAGGALGNPASKTKNYSVMGGDLVST